MQGERAGSGALEDRVSDGIRIGVIGATGAVGGEVLDVLSESSLEVDDLVLVATEESLGKEVEFQGTSACSAWRA